jgi:hypothetical protein
MIRQNQSEITKELHWYLYGKEEVVDVELIEIYDRLDNAVDEIESELVEALDDEGKGEAEQKLNECQEALRKLVKGFKSYNRAKLKEELERILF